MEFKLEIERINEDIITTSAVCSVPSNEFNVLFKSDGTLGGFTGTNYGVIGDNKYKYSSQSGSWISSSENVSHSNGERPTMESGKWYHLGKDGKIKECLNHKSHISEAE